MRQGDTTTRHDGSRGRGLVLLLVMLAIVAFPATAAAKNDSAWVAPTLLAQAQAQPDASFDVIVRGRPGQNSASIAKDFDGVAGRTKRAFYSISGVAGSLTGQQLVKLAGNHHVLSITPDENLASTDYQSQEVWRNTTGVSALWNVVGALGALLPAPQAPTIAVVDSGIDPGKSSDFGSRVVAHVDFCSLCPAGSAGRDLEGHGTMVAGLAAGNSSLYPGVARNANLVDLRTAGADGGSRTSDVIAATDWILQNKDRYGIRVANYSMKSAHPSTFRYDPLDAAVESLWFHGVFVVAAVGNYGVANTPQKVQYSPGNDPFVISVGAVSTNGTATPADGGGHPHQRRLPAVVGLRPDAGRLREAGALAAGPVDGRSGSRRRDTS